MFPSPHHHHQIILFIFMIMCHYYYYYYYFCCTIIISAIIQPKSTGTRTRIANVCDKSHGGPRHVRSSRQTFFTLSLPTSSVRFDRVPTVNIGVWIMRGVVAARYRQHYYLAIKCLGTMYPQWYNVLHIIF